MSYDGLRTEVPMSDVRWSSSSGADTYGRLFEWKGELYRHVRPQFREQRLAVLRSPSVELALKSGALIATEEAPLQLQPGDLVLRHDRVPVVSYPSEWSTSMLKDAAYLILDLESLLARDGLAIGDANPWNVLFAGARPVFVDFGAITHLSDPVLWMVAGCDLVFPAGQQFDRFFLNPLRVMAAGHDQLVRALLNDYRGVLRPEREALTGSARYVLRFAAKRMMTFLDRPARQVAKVVLPGVVRTTVHRLVARSVTREEVPRVLPTLPRPEERLVKLATYRSTIDKLPSRSASVWTTYYEGLHAAGMPGLEPDRHWTPKHHSVYDAIKRTTPGVCLDVGSNTGWYARLAEKHGSYVIAADTDDAVISRLHHQAGEEDLRLLPLVFDLRSPTPGTGPLNRWLIPGLERIRADLVMALAVTHHLVFSQEMTFDQIAASLASLSRRWLLVEFVPRSDDFVSEQLGPHHFWYNEECYIAAFNEYFELRQEYPSFPPERRLYLFERRPSQATAAS